MAAQAPWLRIKEIVGEALELDPSERAAFADRLCSRDDLLRAEVLSLLAAYNQANGFSVDGVKLTLPEAIDCGTFIGPYRLERQLGAGGMGQVWLAEQTEPVKRQVALKLIRAGFYDVQTLQRFLSERQSLALMNHPAIAKVFDAGSAGGGQPYLAMEYVDGQAITTFCEERRLNLPDRLKLFLQVCEGVQHAHQKAIIHRDLKPANILVVDVNGKPMPRIIDFGLAKSATPTPDGTLFTQVGHFLGTPGYMSPEQADPGMSDVDTRTDVYSLGVILYQLLTGHTPFDSRHWNTLRLDQVLREIREIDPPRPSTKVENSAVANDPEGKRLAKSLRGDLDCITMKALERDRERRYAMPSELIADIERHLDNRPVAARASSTKYRIRKYVRRHRLGVFTFAGALVLLIAFALTQMVQLRSIRRERDRADFVTKFMSGMFKVSDPSSARGNTITAREILDKGSKEIYTGLARDPELQAQLMQVIGRVYEDLGLFDRARPLLEKAFKLRNAILGPENPKTVQSLDDLASILDSEGHPVEAAELQRRSLEAHKRIDGPDHPDTRKSKSNLAIYLMNSGQYAEGEKLDREVLSAFTHSLGPEHIDTLDSTNNLAADYIREDRPAEARPLLLHALAIERRTLGPNHPLTLASMNNLAAVLMRMNEYVEAEKVQEETRSIQRQVLGPDHPDTAGSTYNLACMAARQGNKVKALTLLREALDHGLSNNEALGMQDDADLRSLRSDPQFRSLTSYGRTLVTTRQSSSGKK